MTAASPTEPIAWLFEHKSLPIDERSVFAYVATPDGVRIKGFAIGGVNLSEQPVSALAGILKPDAQAHDLKLALSVEMPGEHEAARSPRRPWPPRCRMARSPRRLRSGLCFSSHRRRMAE